MSAAKFTRGIKSLNVYFGLVNAIQGDLNFIHFSAYGG